jgi:hypothetical protein
VQNNHNSHNPHDELVIPTLKNKGGVREDSPNPHEIGGGLKNSETEVEEKQSINAEKMSLDVLQQAEPII